MWNPRLYALTCYVGLIGRAAYHGALAQASQDPSSWEAYFLIWLPAFVLLALGISTLSPVVRRIWLAVKGGQERWARKER